MTVQLCARTLGDLTVPRPQYDRTSIKRGIVHLGVGAFHRAHQAVYTDDLLASGDDRWGIAGASLRSSRVRDNLAPQDYLYSVVTRGSDAQETRVIGSLMDVLVTTQNTDLQSLVKQIADPSTQVVTLTITEKGYCHNPGGELDFDHPQVKHDLENPRAPQSAPAILAAGLNRRMTSGAGSLTVLSCDNLAENGRVARNVVTSLVAQQHPDAAHWVRDNVSFPSSMVDRIVPQTTTEDIDALQAQLAYFDAALVTCEPYSQWVIEDRFAGTRPDWTIAGAEFVPDVKPFEQAKLRLLNASHSTLAYLGLLAGYEYIHETMADPTLQQVIRHIMDFEITPTVTVPHGMNLAQYKDSVLQRFANPQVPYLTRQVAADGSLKLAQRILPTIADRMRQGHSTPGLYLAIAAWLRCLEGRADDGSSITINDPTAQPIASLIESFPEPAALLHNIAQQTAQFGDLSQNDGFLRQVTNAVVAIRKQGGLASAQSLMSTTS